MSALFAGPADGYDRFMGRYSVPLAERFADFAGVKGGHRVLDVGCGPGALTIELARRLGAPAVSAVDPAEQFAAAARERCPGVDVRVGAAEHLPFADDEFDVALAQLVVHFMTNPSAGIREMARVTRTGGAVAACVWDHAGHSGPLERFWAGARALDPDVDDEAGRAGARDRHLVELFQASGPPAPTSDRSRPTAAPSCANGAGSSDRRGRSRSPRTPGRRGGPWRIKTPRVADRRSTKTETPALRGLPFENLPHLLL
jgi:SAM-dependent methyltransferase